LQYRGAAVVSYILVREIKAILTRAHSSIHSSQLAFNEADDDTQAAAATMFSFRANWGSTISQLFVLALSFARAN
jgi:hypothetical protein